MLTAWVFEQAPLEWAWVIFVQMCSGWIGRQAWDAVWVTEGRGFSYGAPGVENSYSHGILFPKSPDMSLFLLWFCIFWNISAMWFTHRHNPEITQVFAKWVVAVWMSQQSCPEVLEVSPTWFLEVIHGLARLAQALSGRSLETLFSGAYTEVKCLGGWAALLGCVRRVTSGKIQIASKDRSRARPARESKVAREKVSEAHSQVSLGAGVTGEVDTVS